MKWKLNTNKILLLFLTILYSTYSINCETSYEMLNTAIESPDSSDSDDIMLKMKNFFDEYAKKVNEQTNVVDKLLLPSDRVEYIKNYNPNSIKILSNNYIEDLSAIRNRDLNLITDDKEKSEEKFIDLITKNKILNSRINSSSSDKTKLENDYNEKNSNKNAIKREIKVNIIKSSESNLKSQSQNLRGIKDNIKSYDNKIKSLNLNEEIFEDEFKLLNNIEDIHSNTYKSIFEGEFLNNEKSNKINFINKAKELKFFLDEKLKFIRKKKDETKRCISVDEGNVEKLKEEVKNKYESYNELNETVGKLQNMENEYKKILGDVNDNVSVLKTKKAIINENITELKTQGEIRKKTIESVLNALEKQLDGYNVDKINVNKFRKDITNINRRISNLLGKENMLFKTNKIKI